jgi:phosphoribosylaminoimidazolecarboxamide formyltransferase / IMP cyclohydrolase
MEVAAVKRAIISVSDKTGLVEFARRLSACGVELVSTGGSRKTLEEAGVPVIDISACTGFPEMMDGRVKTLHPKVHGGILAIRDNPQHLAAMQEHGIGPFDLVVVNLYPFAQTIAKPGVSVEEAIENIDIGGPTLIRSAAKNHAFVTIACDPAQYDRIATAIETGGGTTFEHRRELAGAAFAHTSQYDTNIAAYFARITGIDEQFPEQLNLSLSRKAALRYGENPHQAAALYVIASASPHAVVNAEQLNGKELSYNNLLDLDAALAVARSLPVPGVAVLKHNNPCGAATGSTIGEATRKAWEGDPLSAFGSILGFNAPVDAESAACLVEPGKFVEAIVAPDFTPKALELLTTKPKWKANVRLLRVGSLPPGTGERQLRALEGGYLAQDADDQPDDETAWQVVTTTQPTAVQWADLRFAWAACRHVKSNAIVLAREGMLVGVGAGQMSRVDSVEISIKKAGERTRGAVLASDAFFPFDDSIHTAHAAGIGALIQPGGSVRDAEVIAACNEHGLAMVFTGVRHFRH